MIKNIMYLSITAFMLFKLCDGIDWHKVDATVYRTYQGAAAGFSDKQTNPVNKPALAILAAATVVVPVPEDAYKVPVAGEVAGCTENCEGNDSEEPVTSDAAGPRTGEDRFTHRDKPAQPDETPAVVVKNGQ